MPENHVEQMTEDRKKQIEEFFAEIVVPPEQVRSIDCPSQRELNNLLEIIGCRK